MALQGILIRALEAVWQAEELVTQGEARELEGAADRLGYAARELANLVQPADQGEWGGARRLASVFLQARLAVEMLANYRQLVQPDDPECVFLHGVDQPLQEGVARTLSQGEQLLKWWWLAQRSPEQVPKGSLLR